MPVCHIVCKGASIYMNIGETLVNGQKIAVLTAGLGEILISDPQSALDLMMSVKYQTGAARIAMDKQAVNEAFFVLSTGLAGEILQKFINYGVKAAFWGDFSHYTSKPLRDFIRESNRGTNFFFVSTQAEALEKLSQ